MKNLKRKPLLFVSILGALALAGCQNMSVGADKPIDDQSKGLVETVKEVLMPETKTIPAGTKVRVRLNQTVSSGTNQSGDTFTALLDAALTSDGETLAPAGLKVVGELPLVKDSGKVKGKAEMQLTLREIIIDGSEYDLETHPVTIRAEGSEKKDAAVIAGSAAAGAVIGAISGGGKGAAIGAGVGGGAGTGYVLATKGKQVEFGPESQFEFTLSEDLELPVLDTSEGK